MIISKSYTIEVKQQRKLCMIPKYKPLGEVKKYSE
jgi:hypothetical protein